MNKRKMPAILCALFGTGLCAMVLRDFSRPVRDFLAYRVLGRASDDYRLQMFYKGVEKEYARLRRDDDLLQDFRKELLDVAIKYCSTLAERPSIPIENRDAIRRACNETKNALQSGDIQDGVPRLLFACIMPESSLLRVTWVESDFDTSSLSISNEDGSITLEANLFEHHNIEKVYLFNYRRWCAVQTKPVSEITDAPASRLHIIVEYQGAPCFEPDLWKLSDPTDWATLYIPEGKVYLSIRDKAGHESNKLPIIRLEATDFPQEESSAQNSTTSGFQVQRWLSSLALPWAEG